MGITGSSSPPGGQLGLVQYMAPTEFVLLGGDKAGVLAAPCPAEIRQGFPFRQVAVDGYFAVGNGFYPLYGRLGFQPAKKG